MITVEGAKPIMMAMVVQGEGEVVPLDQAPGRYASGIAVQSPVDHPMFTCSAVDGYAFKFDERKEWKVVLEVAAGDASDVAIEPGECARIFTGAMLPMFTDTVVMQEFVLRDGDRITHSDARLKRNTNVRFKGEQLRAGAIVHKPGALYTPQVVGLLAALGITTVHVKKVPRVVVITSGGEFNAGDQLQPGKIFNSNAVMLAAALRRSGVAAGTMHCQDEQHQLHAAIDNTLKNADVLITTGGVSVGDHDLIRPVLEKLGAEIHFHNVAQKPGKPMLFATLKGKPIFGLPGNPRAVMILFWEYVLPFLRAMQGAADPWLKSEHLPLTHAVELKGERAEFRAAQVASGKVTLLADEGSHMLRSLVEADALAYFPSDARTFKEGDPLEIHYLTQ